MLNVCKIHNLDMFLYLNVCLTYVQHKFTIYKTHAYYMNNTLHVKNMCSLHRLINLT